jgi:hypothetical protein
MTSGIPCDLGMSSLLSIAAAHMGNKPIADFLLEQSFCTFNVRMGNAYKFLHQV